MTADPNNGTPEDPGYTKGKHLNFEGAVIDDDPVITDTGEKIILESPKLCIYYDPSFYSLTNLDVMDLNPVKQPFHKTQGTHIVVKVLIFLFRNAEAFVEAPIVILQSLLNSMDYGEEGETTFFSVTNDILSFLGQIIEWVGVAIIGFLEEVGQINRSVDDKVYGCVKLPLGPFPPPCCETVAPFFPVAQTYRICHIGDDGLPVESVEGNECVVSTLRNNYIHNSIRTGYDHFVPLCEHGEDPMTTDKCVVIENMDSFASASLLHVSTARRDIIKHCDDAPAGAVCVRSMLPHKCSVTSNGCQDGFRVVYATQLGSLVNARQYFRDDLSDCTNSTNAVCQKIWGINIGEFVDTSLSFEEIHTNEILPLSNSFTLVDKNDREAFFNSSIVRMSESNMINTAIQYPQQICVFEGDMVVGCESRAPKPKISVYECGGGMIPGLSCTSTYFSPQFIASYSSEYKVSESTTAIDRTSAVIAPESIHNTSSINNIINLAGDTYDSFVTDESFQVKPFPGPPNPNSLFGNYKDDILPYDENTGENPDAIYLSGLEYIMGKYHLGGKNNCLTSSSNKKCPDNPKLCVLTKLLNTNTVKCSVFMSKSMQYGGFVRCTDNQTFNCAEIDTMTKIGGGTVKIRSCDNGVTCYDSSNELCIVSTSLDNRMDPSPSLGTTLSEDQYYDSSSNSEYASAPTGSSSQYDTDLYALRDKTALEMGLCVNVPQGTCPEQTNYSEANNYAYWPTTQVEKIAQGTCKTGYVADGPLKRRCLALPETKTFAFEKIDSKCIVPTLSQKSNGNYIISSEARTLGINITISVLEVNAAFNSSVGHYFLDNNGNPISGIVDIGSTQSMGNASSSYGPSSIPANATEIGFFLIPDGYNQNNNLNYSTYVTFQNSGNWKAYRSSNNQLIKGDKRDAFFTDRGLNPTGSQQAKITRDENLMEWKDQDNGGERADFRNLVLRVDAKIEP
jgi:hypothetical protein